MNNAKWTWAAIGWMCGFAYAVSLIVYQTGQLFTGAGFSLGTAAALAVLIGMLWLLFRPAPDLTHIAAKNTRSVSARA